MGTTLAQGRRGGERTQPAGRDRRSALPGLTRFEPGDAALFFGRDGLVGQLTDLARRRRFTAVFGPSGSGKSSLLRAGLISRLRNPGEGEPVPAAVRILTPAATRSVPTRSGWPRCPAPRRTPG